jgi:opacity protein-like surface antigen
MRSVKFFVVAGAASLLSSMASAADMAIAAPPMGYGPPPVAAADFGGWYLRGDVGFSNQRVDTVRNTNAALYSGLTSFSETTGYDSGGLYQLGAGYKFNSWFRVDVTGEYRGSANFHGLDLISFPNGGATGYGSDVYNASHSGWLLLANAYADLGTWYCITPYVGAGIGTAQVKVANFTDSGVATLFPTGSGVGPSLVSAATGSQWNFAWALHAGLSYQVNPNMAIDLGYSYVNMGSGATGVDAAFDNSAGGHVFQFHNITSQDVKLGVRWNLWNPPAPSYAPLVTKG